MHDNSKKSSSRTIKIFHDSPAKSCSSITGIRKPIKNWWDYYTQIEGDIVEGKKVVLEASISMD